LSICVKAKTAANIGRETMPRGVNLASPNVFHAEDVEYLSTSRATHVAEARTSAHKLGMLRVSGCFVRLARSGGHYAELKAA
jgi:hypothetical protein